MIRLSAVRPTTVEDAHAMLQTAIGVEFGTLPPYLYALYTIRPGTNAQASQRIKAIAQQEMIHMCLASNILNALGGNPLLKPQAYPGPLPGDIGPPGGQPLTIHLLPFSKDAMKQGMDIEQPENPADFPVVSPLLGAEFKGGPETMTIGQFYDALDKFLATLPADAWHPGRHQIVDDQFFPGQLFAINDYRDANRAIQEIVSEGEGHKENPLDFQDEVSHYYRFGEMYNNKVLTKTYTGLHYQYGPASLDIDYALAYPAIADPGEHDFSQDSAAAQAAQAQCSVTYAALVENLQMALTGTDGALGMAVQAMFALRTAAMAAVKVPLADGKVSGPAFLYQPSMEAGWP
jgi:hypothetical protein